MDKQSGVFLEDREGEGDAGIMEKALWEKYHIFMLLCSLLLFFVATVPFVSYASEGFFAEIGEVRLEDEDEEMAGGEADEGDGDSGWLSLFLGDDRYLLVLW